MNQEDKLSIIRDILLIDEREFAASIEKKINDLELSINVKDELSQKVNPIIDEKIAEFIKSMPNEFSSTITEALKQEIKNSQDEVVEVLFPILGKMVKRYVQHEMKMLSENINNQLNKTFSYRRFFGKAKSKVTGVKDSDLIIQKQLQPKIEQIIFIEKGSGIVLAEYSKEKTMDEDMVGGMLTAIKSFTEDAFKKENQDLNYIEYDHYHIHLQNFSSYYIAVLVSGAYNVIYKDRLEDRLLELTEKFIKPDILKNKTQLTEKIKVYFKDDSF